MRAESAGSHVDFAPDWAGVAALAGSLAREESVLVAPSLAASAPQLMTELGRKARLPDPESPARSAADAPLGIIAGALAVAETGSVLVVEEDLADRAVSMLSLTLVQAVERGSIVSGLDDVADYLSTHKPGYAVLSTASSRTADIERSLTIGVQGPAAVHGVVVG